MKKFLLIILSITAVNFIKAQSVVFTEDFNFTTATAGDSIGGIAGTTSAFGDTTWKKHSGNSTGGRCIKYVTSPLTLAGYAGSNKGGSASLQHTVGSADINGYIGQSINTGSVYTSFLLRVDSSTGNTTTCDYAIHYADLYGAISISNLRNRIFICAGSDSLTKFKIGISKGTAAILTAANITAGAKAPVFASNEYNIGQTYLCILKYTFNTVTTKDDEMTLTIMNTATLPVVEPMADVVLVDTGVSDLTKIQSICLRQGSIGRVKATVDGFRTFTTWDAATVTVLPFCLTSFTASKNENNTTKLVWNVSCEADVVNYILEKSLNGKEFKTVGSLKADNKSNYSLNDNEEVKATTYYRVKFVNKEGKFTFSNIVSVNTLKSIKLEVFPNPAQNNLVLSYPKLNVDANVSINTFDGKNVMSIAIKAGTTQSSIDISSLNKGTYMVSILDIDGNKTTKTIIKN